MDREIFMRELRETTKVAGNTLEFTNTVGYSKKEIDLYKQGLSQCTGMVEEMLSRELRNSMTEFPDKGKLYSEFKEQHFLTCDCDGEVPYCEWLENKVLSKSDETKD